MRTITPRPARECGGYVRSRRANVSSKEAVLSVTSACGTPLWHREPDGTYVDSATGEPLPTEDEDEDEDEPRPKVTRKTLPDSSVIETHYPMDDDDEDHGKDKAQLRKNGFLNCIEDAGHHLDWFLKNAPEAIDDEMIEAAWKLGQAWEQVVSDLEKKRASTLPQDGRSSEARCPQKARKKK